jgi:alanyl-tRNA synthetase
MMTGNEIRQKFLEYFEQRGHRPVHSSPLLPANDPTLLFTNAGMNQFKDVFLGLEKRDYVRAASSQKCIRAGGKHNDLDEVGKTARHQTFFEMLGNFSFGDYFKREAIQYAWDFLVNQLGLDPERLWFTVFAGDDEVAADDEAARLWEEVGARPERILRFGRKDNFWQMAETGPCGPNSEINYYLGEHPEDPNFNRADLVNGPGDTTMEIWNLVFMQYNRIETEPGKYKLELLPKPSVDTGLGLERVAVVLQDVKSNYDTDLLRPIVEFTAQLADRHYEPDTAEGFAMRVVADHARATVFAIADNILPGNEGRNYVLRKIMRRAIYQGRHALRFQDAFFYKVTDFVVGEMREAYPELEAAREFIERMVKLEEERFGSTLTVGLQKLDALFSVAHDGALPDYKELARLYDTFGTPRDLIRVSMEERGFPIDEETFNASFDAALKGIQSTGEREHMSAGTKVKPVYAVVAERAGRSEFRGYEETRTDGVHVIALINGEEEVEELREGEDGEVVLDRTPFYAESGGQVGDTGIFVNSNSHVTVNDTVSPLRGLVIHRVTVERGALRVGDELTAQVDVEKRDATRRNHTATHLMHAALREVLGTHVKQAGSVVAPNYLRFDFTHYQPLTRTEIAEIERLVNYHILRNEPVETNVMAIEEAMRSGAMALFGEKYGEQVRVLSIKGAENIFSKELCGGTHVRATGDIGLFKITSDESIASGTRRIRAVTGADAFTRFQETEALVDSVASELRASRTDIPVAVERLQEELKKARREADELRLKLAMGGSSSSNGDEAREVAEGVKVLAREASGLDTAGMRQLSDTLLARIKSGVVIIGRTGDGKVSLIVRTSPDLLKRVPAGQVIKELAPIVGGRGGGKPDMAEGGGSQPEKLAEALEASYGVVEKLLG